MTQQVPGQPASMSQQVPGGPASSTSAWSVVIPVKLTAQAKTRLAGDLSPQERAELARAMVVDTVAAARSARSVRQVLVVTGDEDVVADLRSVRSATWAPLVVVPEPVPAAGLNAAVRAGITAARASALTPPGATAGDPGVTLAEGPVAVLLGDLPALRPDDLDDALTAASAFPRAVVVDTEGTGTTLLTAAAGVVLDPAFGVGSAAEHLRRGHVALDVPARSGLRQDVDRLGDLAAVAALGTGRATSQVLAGRARSGPDPLAGSEPLRSPVPGAAPSTDETAAVA